MKLVILDRDGVINEDSETDTRITRGHRTFAPR
jgi:histidinol phosphatase-like enzyme